LGLGAWGLGLAWGPPITTQYLTHNTYPTQGGAVSAVDAHVCVVAERLVGPRDMEYKVMSIDAAENVSHEWRFARNVQPTAMSEWLSVGGARDMRVQATRATRRNRARVGYLNKLSRF
jgi:hypothetical protein